MFADELYPLEVGRYWRYAVEGDGPKSVTNSITRSKTVRGTTWYLLNEWGENFWVRNAPAGRVFPGPTVAAGVVPEPQQGRCDLAR